MSIKDQISQAFLTLSKQGSEIDDANAFLLEVINDPSSIHVFPEILFDESLGLVERSYSTVFIRMIIRKHSILSDFCASLAANVFAIVFAFDLNFGTFLIELLHDLAFHFFSSNCVPELFQIQTQNVHLLLFFFSRLFNDFIYQDQVELLSRMKELFFDNITSHLSQIRIASLNLIEAVVMDFPEIELDFEEIFSNYMTGQFPHEESLIFMNTFSYFVDQGFIQKNFNFYFELLLQALTSETLSIPFRSLLFPVLHKMYNYCENHDEIFRISFFVFCSGSHIQPGRRILSITKSIFCYFLSGKSIKSDNEYSNQYDERNPG